MKRFDPFQSLTTVPSLLPTSALSARIFSGICLILHEKSIHCVLSIDSAHIP